MANSYFTQFFYTKHAMPVLLDCNVVIGATGAVGTIKGPGVSTVTRLSAGLYQIKLLDNYYKLYGVDVNFRAPVSGANVTAGSFSVGPTYEITALGNTNWQTAGLPTGLTAAVGMVFKAAAVGSGTGTAKILGSSGIYKAETVGGNEMLSLSTTNQGGLVTIKCLGPTAADDTALVATDPAEGSVMYVSMYLSNSSVVVRGE
jgi:hypothetical protein